MQEGGKSGLEDILRSVLRIEEEAQAVVAEAERWSGETIASAQAEAEELLVRTEKEAMEEAERIKIATQRNAREIGRGIRTDTERQIEHLGEQAALRLEEACTLVVVQLLDLSDSSYRYRVSTDQ